MEEAAKVTRSCPRESRCRGKKSDKVTAREKLVEETYHKDLVPAFDSVLPLMTSARLHSTGLAAAIEGLDRKNERVESSRVHGL